MRTIFHSLALVLLTGVLEVYAQERQLLDRIVAVVDEEVILASELQQYTYMEAASRKINPQVDSEAFLQLEHQVLEALINQKIMLAQAKIQSLDFGKPRY